MPTFTDHFVAELARSGVLEHLKPWGELFDQVLKMPGGMFLMASAIAERAEQNFPSKGYRSYFEAQGFSPVLARGLGSLTISGGKRQAKEAKRVAPVIEAIRFLARGDGQRRAIVSRARLVLAASKDTSIVDELFSIAGLHEGEFLRLLQTVIDGGAIDRERIRAIAAAIALSQPLARGPKISAASATHELFLETNASFGLPAGYPKRRVNGEYIDPQTQATKQEFSNADFDPRAAYRRVKRRGLVKTGSSGSPIR
jgi:hypothetical protein